MSKTMATKPKSLGHRIRIKMAELEITQEDLAKRAGCGQSTISDIVNDCRPPSDRVRKRLAQILGVSLR